MQRSEADQVATLVSPEIPSKAVGRSGSNPSQAHSESNGEWVTAMSERETIA